MLLMDTHCWIWLELGQQLSRKTVAAVEDAASLGILKLSVFSIWEVGMLHVKRRVHLPLPLRDWIHEALATPGLSVEPLTPEIAIESNLLPGDIHGDPADRIIVATARVLGATLVTRDKQLIAYSRQRHVRVLAA